MSNHMGFASNPRSAHFDELPASAVQMMFQEVTPPRGGEWGLRVLVSGFRDEAHAETREVLSRGHITVSDFGAIGDPPNDMVF